MKKRYGILLMCIGGCTPPSEKPKEPASKGVVDENPVKEQNQKREQGTAHKAAQPENVPENVAKAPKEEMKMNQSLIIAFKDTAISQSQAEADVQKALTGVSAFKLEKMYDATFTLKFNSNESTKSLMGALKKIKSVDYVEVDQEVGLLKKDHE